MSLSMMEELEWKRSQTLKSPVNEEYTHTHTHTYVYVYVNIVGLCMAAVRTEGKWLVLFTSKDGLLQGNRETMSWPQ